MKYRIIDKRKSKIIFEGTAVECARVLAYGSVELFLTAKKYHTCKYYIEEVEEI